MCAAGSRVHPLHPATLGAPGDVVANCAIEDHPRAPVAYQVQFQAPLNTEKLPLRSTRRSSVPSIVNCYTPPTQRYSSGGRRREEPVGRSRGVAILVSGASGFIGCRLVSHLHAQNEMYVLSC